MWEQIMSTEDGREFRIWLDEEQGISWDENYKRFYIGYNVYTVNIINNLAVEWLDGKGLRLSVYHETFQDYDGWTYCFECDNNTVEDFKTRQEAISAGVDKAFALLGGE